jgi:hypothetical protein
MPVIVAYFWWKGKSERGELEIEGGTAVRRMNNEL